MPWTSASAWIRTCASVSTCVRALPGIPTWNSSPPTTIPWSRRSSRSPSAWPSPHSSAWTNYHRRSPTRSPSRPFPRRIGRSGSVRSGMSVSPSRLHSKLRPVPRCRAGYHQSLPRYFPIRRTPVELARVRRALPKRVPEPPLRPGVSPGGPVVDRRTPHHPRRKPQSRPRRPDRPRHRSYHRPPHLHPRPVYGR